MADTVCARDGLENNEKFVFDLLDKACDCLDREETDRDGYYAFVCEKCAPSFSYYGYFAFADELKKRTEDIYERA